MEMSGSIDPTRFWAVRRLEEEVTKQLNNRGWYATLRYFKKLGFDEGGNRLVVDFITAARCIEIETKAGRELSDEDWVQTCIDLQREARAYLLSA